MKSKSTVFWLVLAVTLAAAIWVSENYFQSGAAGPKPLFEGLRGERVMDIEIIPAGAREIDVTRSNGVWLLQKPLSYPAQAVAIDGLLAALQKLTPVTAFSAGEMNSHKNADAEFGFDNPQYTINLTAGDESWHLHVGNKTAPGDGVYVRVVGAAGAFVTDTAWLQFLPRDVAEWRDITLADMPSVLNWLVVTNGTQAIELRRDVTNRLWRMVRPLQARADNLRILTAVQQLRTAKVSQFISDDPKADLTGYGLEPAALDVWLGDGTNLLSGIHAGKDVKGAAGEMYARREGWNTVVTTAKEPLAPWRGTVNDFRDPNLLELTAPPAEIEVHGDYNYTLQQKGSNTWVMAGEKFPVDADRVQGFIKTLTSLRIADFAQDVVTASGLQNFGLATPTRQITLRSAAGDTNSVVVQVLFGATNTTSQIYVKRGDEDFVYAVKVADMGQLTLPGDCFRTQNIWSFSETNVAQVTVRRNGKTRQLVRNGTNDWSLAAGQGIINPLAVEETVHRLGDLNALIWVGRMGSKITAPDIGLTTNGLSITTELKTGEKYTVDFGIQEWLASLNTQTPLAVVTLDGERWAFLFPPLLYRLIDESLTIPADTP